MDDTHGKLENDAHRTASDGVNGRTERATLVYPAMVVAGGLSVVEASRSERCVHASGHRHVKRFLAEAFRRDAGMEFSHRKGFISCRCQFGQRSRDDHVVFMEMGVDHGRGEPLEERTRRVEEFERLVTGDKFGIDGHESKLTAFRLREEGDSDLVHTCLGDVGHGGDLQDISLPDSLLADS